MSSNSLRQTGPLVRALSAASVFLERIAIVMLLLTTSLVILQVIARNFFQMGLPWADELARYGGLGIVFLAVPLLLLHDRHIAVDIISARVRGRAGMVLRICNEVIVLLFCILFLIGGYAFLVRAGRFVTPALSMPNLPFYLPAMLGMIMFAIVSLLRFARVVSGHPVAAASQAPAMVHEESVP
jgi:TRAP-type C4-dicarboxylate transport system permease small subunit